MEFEGLKALAGLLTAERPFCYFKRLRSQLSAVHG